MSQGFMNIGEAAAAAGVSPKMVRHYEQIGLLPEARRTDSGYRQYGEREVNALRFVRQSRGLGFSIEQIRELIGLWGDRGRRSQKVKRLAQAHLADLELKLAELTAMKRSLEELVAACAGDEGADCAILDGLEGKAGCGKVRASS